MAYRLLLLAMVLLCAAPASASIALVQKAFTYTTASQTTDRAFPSSNGAGNVSVVFVVWDSPGASVAVSDSRGNSYLQVTTATKSFASKVSGVAVFVASNIGAGANTV